MKKVITLTNAFMILATLFCISCKQQTQTGSSTRVIEQNTANEKNYQEVMSRMETYKANILKHEDIYNISMQAKGSLLDKREAIEAAKEIVNYSKTLLEIVNSSLNNEKLISSVSGGRNTILEYKKFAEQKIEKYE